MHFTIKPAFEGAHALPEPSSTATMPEDRKQAGQRSVCWSGAEYMAATGTTRGDEGMREIHSQRDLGVGTAAMTASTPISRSSGGGLIIDCPGAYFLGHAARTRATITLQELRGDEVIAWMKIETTTSLKDRQKTQGVL